MAGIKEIKRRIKSVQSIKKITKAMELVAASKMRKVVQSAISSRLYAKYSWDILSSIARSPEAGQLDRSLNSNAKDIWNKFFTKRETKNILIVLITSDRGLCGIYNLQIIRKTLDFINNQKNITEDIKIDIATIGKKGDVFVQRLGLNVVASFTEIKDNFSLKDILSISKFLAGEYISLRYDKILIAYTDYISALVQKPCLKQILPISKTESGYLTDDLEKVNLEKAQGRINYLFEGDYQNFIEKLVKKLIQMQIYQMLLESNASEQSARMLAMKNANDASIEIIDDLTLAFNKVRQANITREISEISAGITSVN